MDTMKQAEHIWAMLDELADSDPDSYKKFIKKTVEEGKTSPESPQPSMCIKTRILNTNQNCDLFVNICSWTKVPRPKTDHDPIPVIAGEMKDVEENEKTSKVVAIAFNPDVLKECYEAQDTTSMLLNLALDFIRDQLKVKVDRRYIRLKDSKFKGELVTLIRSFERKKSPDNGSKQETKEHEDPMMGLLGKILHRNDFDAKTSDVIKLKTTETTAEPTNSVLIQEITSAEVSLPQPEYQLEIIDGDEERGRRLNVKILLPTVKSVQECDLDVSEDDVNLFVEDLYNLQLALPEAVVETEASAKFNKKSATLTVTILTKHQDKK